MVRPRRRVHHVSRRSQQCDRFARWLVLVRHQRGEYFLCAAEFPVLLSNNSTSPQTSNPAFITSYAQSGPSLRNNFSGWVGTKFTVGSGSLSITSLGRVCVTGNSSSHTVKLVNAATGSDLPGGSAVVNMSGCARSVSVCRAAVAHHHASGRWELLSCKSRVVGRRSMVRFRRRINDICRRSEQSHVFLRWFGLEWTRPAEYSTMDRKFRIR